MTNLLHNEALKRVMNLSSMRKNGRNKLKIILIRGGAIFGLLLLIPNSQRTICKFVARSRLTDNSNGNNSTIGPGRTQTCILPIKRTTRKIRNLASAELCATSKYEVVGYLIYK